MIERELLIEKLNSVAPALAENDLLPALTHFAFTGTHVVTFSEKVGMTVPLQTEFKGLVPGKILMDLLSISTHATRGVDLTPAGTSVRIRAGKTDVKLAMLPLERITSVFKMPAMNAATALQNDDFFTAIEDCLQAVSKYAVVPDQLGITMVISDGDVDLYTTDKKTIAHARLPLATAADRRMILNPTFCEQMLRLRGGDNKKIAFGANYALFQSGDVRLFGKLVESKAPLDFAAAVRTHMPKNVDRGMIDIPERLNVALGVLSRISSIKGAEERTKVRIRAGKCTLAVESKRGSASDELQLKGHPDIETDIYASVLLAGCQRFNRIMFGPSCAVLKRATDGPSSVYMVANCGT